MHDAWQLAAGRCSFWRDGYLACPVHCGSSADTALCALYMCVLLRRWNSLDQFMLAISTGGAAFFSVALQCLASDTQGGCPTWGRAFELQGGTVPFNRWTMLTATLSPTGQQVVARVSQPAASVAAELLCSHSSMSNCRAMMSGSGRG